MFFNSKKRPVLSTSEKAQVLTKQLAQNPFALSPNYHVTLDFHRIFEGLTLYREQFEGVDFKSQFLIAEMTPDFQRSNNKWSEPMQISFIENLLSGCDSKILLFSTQDTLEECYILDGLQRLTAISAFMNDKFMVFGQYKWSEIKSKMVTRLVKLSIQIFQFDDQVAACKHYIAINRNITHSPEDIAIAEQYIGLSARSSSTHED